MGLKSVFQSGVETTFKVFKEAVVTSQYIQITDDGFDTPEEVKTQVRSIIDSFKQDDIEKLSFADEIQPTDLKCLVPGADIGSIALNTKDSFKLLTKYDGTELNETYSVIAFDTDPFKALYTILLRNA